MNIEEEVLKCKQQIHYIKSNRNMMTDSVTSYLLGKAEGRLELLTEMEEINEYI